MFLVSSRSCLRSIHWTQVLSWEWRCSWSSANRRCSNYIWVINNIIAYKGATYIRGFTVITYLHLKFNACSHDFSWRKKPLSQNLIASYHIYLQQIYIYVLNYLQISVMFQRKCNNVMSPKWCPFCLDFSISTGIPCDSGTICLSSLSHLNIQLRALGTRKFQRGHKVLTYVLKWHIKYKVCLSIYLGTCIALTDKFSLW